MSFVVTQVKANCPLEVVWETAPFFSRDRNYSKEIIKNSSGKNRKSNCKARGDDNESILSLVAKCRHLKN